MNTAWLCDPTGVATGAVPLQGGYEDITGPHRHWGKPGHLDDVVAMLHGFGLDLTDLNVLDVGCGRGHLLPYLRKLGVGYAGVDVSAVLVALAKTDFPGVNFMQADVEALPLPSSSADVVVCWDVLIHIPDMVKGLTELIRVARRGVILRLRTGGVAGKKHMVYDPARGRLFKRLGKKGMPVYFNVLTHDGLRELMTTAGIRDYEVAGMATPGDQGCRKTTVSIRLPQ